MCVWERESGKITHSPLALMLVESLIDLGLQVAHLVFKLVLQTLLFLLFAQPDLVGVVPQRLDTAR